MRDVIWTVIVIWVVYQLYKILTSARVQVFQKHDHHYHASREGEVKIDKKTSNSSRKPNSDKGGEYVDFEEIKE